MTPEQRTIQAHAVEQVLLDRISERFWSKVDATGDCWEWAASLFVNTGYGWFRYDGRGQGAHRVAWELLVGPIPAGLQLDHLCRNRRCVNPDHLEPVTLKENLRRGFQHVVARRRTHCPKGHAYDASNTFITRIGSRQCRTCHRAGDSASQARRRLARAA